MSRPALNRTIGCQSTRVPFSTAIAVLQQLNDSSSPGLIGGVRFEGTSGFVAFHDDGSRVNPSFQVLVSPPLSNGTSILVGVVEFGEDGSSRELQKTQAWFSLAQANQPWFNSTCDVFPSANDDQPCPRCDNALIIPIVVGVIAFLAAVIFILYCGRQRVGAQLFEQTALAEQEAKVAMQEAAVKSSFLANMSHEIRTPLHAILSMSRMLMDSREKDPNASPQDLEDLSQIIKSSETLQALVNDILFISKMQTASFELGNRTMDVCELLEDITQLLALRWSGKNVECQTLLRVPEFYFEVGGRPRAFPGSSMRPFFATWCCHRPGFLASCPTPARHPSLASDLNH